MDWNWQRINGTKNVPDFGSSVLLLEMRDDDKNYAVVGSLKSIDAEGCHWSTQANSVFDIFGAGLFTPEIKSEFQPTHWCIVKLPKKDK